jgi:hypothetical protein
MPDGQSSHPVEESTFSSPLCSSHRRKNIADEQRLVLYDMRLIKQRDRKRLLEEKLPAASSFHLSPQPPSIFIPDFTAN